MVRDQFADLAANAEIVHHWLGGHHLAWAFVDGWGRLSDGQRAVWIGTPSARIEPAATVDEFVKAKDAALEDAEFLRGARNEVKEANEESDRIQAEFQNRVRSRNGS